MNNRILEINGIDPRIKATFGALPPNNMRDFDSREDLIGAANSDKANATRALFNQFLEANDNPAIAPDNGLLIQDYQFTSTPDGNRCNLRFIRPDTDERLPCVYYIHGGGMQFMSCYDGNYRAWGKLMARKGVAVAMVDFRNAIVPSSVPEIAPFPAGLNDCISGLKWLWQQHKALNIDPAQVVISGESGGGNLAIATTMKLNRDGEADRLKGLFALCPYIAGEWPQAKYPSSSALNGVFLQLDNNQGRMGYGIEAFEQKNPLAWPGFATAEDVTGFPPTIISVNEFDPLRDEGIEFYRLLVRAGVPKVRCREVKGTIHGTELFPLVCPEISADTAASLVDFCRR
ncbi:alpha/beta hydrolase [Marinobacterium lutimaris]|uniref:Acetyl esterase/lipase n=1 Tax=Marinobacterium lutimaris TaxID=568106 RepID=A0A1H5UYC3_9GAMM|nr:alpha/beta hydrolase fold domain-containing protein [Marinobacterium lutimaris]SEF80006.1 Acetyl esterase/lipase [Marinobacterium lutimaris]